MNLKLLLPALALFATATISHGALAGYWNFNDGTANDSSGNGNHGTFTNGASASANVPTGGGAFSLAVGGGTQHVLVPDSASLDIAGAITITAWVQRPATGWGAILAKSPSEGSNPNFPGNYELRLGNGDGIQTLLWEDGASINTAPSIVDTSSVAADIWTHIALSGTNSGAYTFYINGVATGTGTTPASFLTSQNDSPLYLGSRGDLFTTINGNLDEISIWNEALDAGEINSIFLNGVPVPEPSTALLSALALTGLAMRRRRI